MCGRYSQTLDLAEVVKRFSAKQPSFNCKPCYNIAPGAVRPVVCAGGLKLLKWGFLPGWAGAGPAHIALPQEGNSLERKFSSETLVPEADAQAREGLINARAEGIASRPAFRTALYKTRCLVAADGFYEWQHSAGVKTPYRFELRDKGLFAMAGVYEEKTGTYAIITAAANALVRTVHHRMPVILERRHEALWLDPKMKDSEVLLPLLRGYDSSLMHGYRVSDLVNDPKNDSPDCLKPLQS
ncbi:MAG TPA: SOS response-associated peptidase [Elusimicrobiales bacterium]|nr:SOS response-associated peptidase [Elusimicrobiales bacterium]